ncbi:hypothetical protein Bca101_043608 [Brassica carinata]
MIAEIYEALQHSEDCYYRKFDDIYFPFDNSIEALHSRTEGIDKEIKAIQRQLATCPSPFTSTDMPTRASIGEGTTTSIDIGATTSIDTDTPSVRQEAITDRLGVLHSIHEELSEPSRNAYDKLEKQQFDIENFERRLHLLKDELENMKKRWTRSDDATRSFTATQPTEKEDVCTPANNFFHTN